MLTCYWTMCLLVAIRTAVHTRTVHLKRKMIDFFFVVEQGFFSFRVWRYLCSRGCVHHTSLCFERYFFFILIVFVFVPFFCFILCVEGESRGSTALTANSSLL
ncbi:unnamed protein product [Choristocarpus tenellus]